VLLSDGRDTGSVVSPDEAVARAQEQGIPVFTVTLGDATEGGSTASADDDLMLRIADGTGGSTFNALSADQLTDVYQELGSTLSSDLHVGSSAWIFVLLGGVFALAAVVVLFMPATPAEYRAAPKPGSSKRPARSRS
jgi:Ca-activated chloride channel family protein